ncbi:hypothetical protein BRC21_01695, partial [Candidatus Saccharibacteria bacterium SW_7_54_9]
MCSTYGIVAHQQKARGNGFRTGVRNDREEKSVILNLFQDHVGLIDSGSESRMTLFYFPLLLASCCLLLVPVILNLFQDLFFARNVLAILRQVALLVAIFNLARTFLAIACHVS